MSADARLSSAVAWFEYATEDIKSARVLFDAGIYPSACFHAQQAVEKALKGLLSITDDAGKIHSVTKLSKVVRELKYDEQEALPKVAKLDTYYMTTRYPDMLPGVLATDIYDANDASDAIGVAEQTFLLLAKWSKDAGVDINQKMIAAIENRNSASSRLRSI